MSAEDEMQRLMAKLVEEKLVQANLFKVLVGEKSLGFQVVHHTVRIRYTVSTFLSGTPNIEDMANLRLLLIDRGYEAYWSCGDPKDNRAVGDFSFAFEPPADPDTALVKSAPVLDERDKDLELF
jgi:hypothetical protein